MADVEQVDDEQPDEPGDDGSALGPALRRLSRGSGISRSEARAALLRLAGETGQSIHEVAQGIVDGSLAIDAVVRTRRASLPPPVPSSDVIRRRIEREYVMLRSASRLDRAAIDALLNGFDRDEAANVDVVVDLSECTSVSEGAVDALRALQVRLRTSGNTLTLREPSDALVEALSHPAELERFTVVRPGRARRRRSGGIDPGSR